MFNVHTAVLAAAAVLLASSAQAQVKPEPFKVPYDWMKQAKADRHTSLLVTSDSPDALTADHARGLALGAIYRGELGVQGKSGRTAASHAD